MICSGPRATPITTPVWTGTGIELTQGRPEGIGSPITMEKVCMVVVEVVMRIIWGEAWIQATIDLEETWGLIAGKKYRSLNENTFVAVSVS